MFLPKKKKFRNRLAKTEKWENRERNPEEQKRALIPYRLELHVEFSDTLSQFWDHILCKNGGIVSLFPRDIWYVLFWPLISPSATGALLHLHYYPFTKRQNAHNNHQQLVRSPYLPPNYDGKWSLWDIYIHWRAQFSPSILIHICLCLNY